MHDFEQVIRSVQSVRTSKKWRRGPCPFCEETMGSPDRRRSLGVSSRGYWHCFRCGESGWIPEDMRDAALSSDADVDDLDRLSEPTSPPETFYRLSDPIAKESISLADAYTYLADRGVDDATIRRHQIGVLLGRVEGQDWHGRVILPVLATPDRWWGWSARVWVRDVPPSIPPYLYPRRMPRGEIFFNHRAIACKDTESPLLVVEGVFDAIALGACSVAALGSLSEHQRSVLLDSRRPVVFVYDGDAWEQAWCEACRFRFDGHRAGYVRLPPKTDPDQVPRAWIEDEARQSLERSL